MFKEVTEFKPFRADGPARAVGWESRTLPGIFLKPVFNFDWKRAFLSYRFLFSPKYFRFGFHVLDELGIKPIAISAAAAYRMGCLCIADSARSGSAPRKRATRDVISAMNSLASTLTIFR